jgi:hypothetical protein
MKGFLTIILLGLYALTLSQAYIPHVDYWVNHDFIASELCENKDRPELKCEGKCHLQKEIQDMNEESQEGQEVSVQLMVEFLQTNDGFTFRPVSDHVQLNFPSRSDKLKNGHLTGVFHPPKV